MILQLKDIKLSFTNARSEVFNLLNGVNLNVKQGEIMALVGGERHGKDHVVQYHIRLSRELHR